MKRPYLTCLAVIFAIFISVAAIAAPTDLDPGFGGSGDLFEPFVGSALVTRLDGRALAVSSDQLTYIVGGANGGVTLEDGFVGVLNANGSIATQVNGSGFTVFPSARFEDLVLLPDGKVLACGLIYTSQVEHRWLVARFNADLSLDTSLAGSGYVQGDLAPLSVCHAIEQLADGRIAITGSSFADPQGVPGFVALLNSDGALDTSFAGSGMLELEYNSQSPGGADIAEAGDSGIWLTTGWWYPGLGGRFNHLQRYSLSGTRTHASFGDVEYFSPRPASSGRIAIDPAGNVLLGEQGGHWDGATTELRINFSKRDLYGGLINSGFLFEFGLADQSGNGYQFADTALLPDGRMMVAGQFIEDGVATPRARLAIQRVRADMGGADYSFFPDNGAYLYRPVGQADGLVDPFPLVRSVAVGRNGRITLLSRRSSGQNGVNVIRFMGDGINSATLDLDPAPMTLGTTTVSPGDSAQSDLVAIDGLPAGLRVPMFVLGGEYKLNSGSWSRNPTYVKYGDFVRVRGVASSTPGAQHTVSLFVGGLRAKNSWDAIGARQRSDFAITSLAQTLVGGRCSDNGFATGCSAAIPDTGTAITSTMSIDYALGGSCNFIDRVRIGLDINHPYLGDLRVTLLDPNYNPFGGEGAVMLLDRTRNGAGGSSGSCTADGVFANFSDAAATTPDAACMALPGGGELSGWLQSTQPLSALVGRRGTNGNGTSSVATWTLAVRDMAGGDVGQLNDWSLEVECSDTPPDDTLFADGFE